MAGGGPLALDDTTLHALNLGGATLYVEAVAAAPPAPAPVDDDDA